MAGDYPKRPRFFAYRFTRLMAKACLANQIGPEACWLLTIIAITEDAKGYRDPVTFYNEQLYPLVGCGSVDALARLRRKAVESGWLHYEPSKKRCAGRYWVVVPQAYVDWDDSPTDEWDIAEMVPQKCGGNTEMPPQKCGTIQDSSAEVRNQARGKCGGKREESAEESAEPPSLTLTQEQEPPLSPKGKPVAIPSELDCEEFRTAWADWHAHRKELKKKFTPLAQSRLLSRLVAWGVPRAVAAIAFSIGQGWQGIYEEGRNGRDTNRCEPPAHKPPPYAEDEPNG